MQEQLSYLKNDEYHIKQELDRIEKRENLSMAKPFWDGVYWVGGKVSGLWGGGTPEQPADKAQSDKADKVAPAV